MPLTKKFSSHLKLDFVKIWLKALFEWKFAPAHFVVECSLKKKILKGYKVKTSFYFHFELQRLSFKQSIDVKSVKLPSYLNSTFGLLNDSMVLDRLYRLYHLYTFGL